MATTTDIQLNLNTPEHMSQPWRVLSLGGGLDSCAMLVWAILQYIATGDRSVLPHLCIFADVTNNKVVNNKRCNDDGRTIDPGEWESTYRHIEEVIVPLCEQYGIEFKWLTSDEIGIGPKTGPKYRSLYAYAMAIKMFYGRMQKTCTSKAKVERITEYLDARWPDQDVEVWIGFEANEVGRAENDPRGPNANLSYKPGQARRRNRWPLIEAELCRCRCEQLVRDFGIPVPRKSACTFCPHSTPGDLRTLLEQDPAQFELIEAYEENSKLTGTGVRKKADGKAGTKMRFSGDPELRVRYYALDFTTYDKAAIEARIARETACVPTYEQRLADAYTEKQTAAAQKKLDGLRQRIADAQAQLDAANRGELRKKAPYQRERKGCDICGAEQKATKATGCDFLQPAEYVEVPRRKSLPVLQGSTPSDTAAEPAQAAEGASEAVSEAPVAEAPAPQAPEATPDTPVQENLVQSIDEADHSPVESEVMSDQTNLRHLVTVSKQPFGSIELSYRPADETFVIHFEYNGAQQTFEHTNVSRCAKHLWCLKQGFSSFEAAREAGVTPPGIGGLNSTYWGRQKIDLGSSTPAPTKPKAATKRATKAAKAPEAPAVTATPEPVPAAPEPAPAAPKSNGIRVKMPTVDHGQLDNSEPWAAYLILIHGQNDAAVTTSPTVALDASQAEWQAAIRELMADGVKRTFNSITSLLAGIEAEEAPDAAIDALWALVEVEGALYHNLVGRPFSFWAPAADEGLSEEAEALLRKQVSAG